MKRVLIGLMAAAVAAIGSGGMALAGGNGWTVYDYNPSGNALAPRVSPNSNPATVSDSTVSFKFMPGEYTALLTTGDKGMTGDLSTKTLTDVVSVTAMEAGATFAAQADACAPSAFVRLYFTSPAGSGPSFPAPGQPVNGLTPAGFYSQFWWSNPMHVDLVNEGTGMAPQTMTASLGDPSQWSDWDGQNGASGGDVTAAFQRAAQNVQSVGLSFGGGCHFESGVTISKGSATFNSTLTTT